MNVGAAGIDADLANDPQGRIAHPLIFLVGQRHGRRNRDAVAGMHAHRIEIFDRADDDDVVLEVAHDFQLVLFPSDQRALDQNLTGGAHRESPVDEFLEFLPIVGDVAAGPAHCKRGADDGGKPDFLEDSGCLITIVRRAALRHRQPDPLHRLLERFAIFGLVNGFRRRPDQLDAVLLQHPALHQPHRGVQRRLSAHRRQQRIRALTLNDFLDDLKRDRLDIRAIGQFRVGHDRRRIAVDQNDLESLLPQSFAGLRPGVVKFTGLADDDRPGPD